MKIFLINPTVHEFSFDEIRQQDVVNVIDKLPSKTSSGVDGISTNLLKDIKYLISKPLTMIINQCLETGIFPSKLKIAKVIPILKKGDETIFFIIIAQSPSYRRYQRYLSGYILTKSIVIFMLIIYMFAANMVLEKNTPQNLLC